MVEDYGWGGYEKSAQKLAQKIYDRTRKLEYNPKMGQRELSLDDLPQGYRRLVEEHYKVIYYIVDDVIWVVDVWDCRRNPAVLREGVVGAEA